MRVKSPPSRASIPEQLGINLASRKEEELFKWFLACLLYGKPIQQEIAERAYTRLVLLVLSHELAVVTEIAFKSLASLRDGIAHLAQPTLSPAHSSPSIAFAIMDALCVAGTHYCNRGGPRRELNPHLRIFMPCFLLHHRPF